MGGGKDQHAARRASGAKYMVGQAECAGRLGGLTSGKTAIQDPRTFKFKNLLEEDLENLGRMVQHADPVERRTVLRIPPVRAHYLVTLSLNSTPTLSKIQVHV